MNNFTLSDINAIYFDVLKEIGNIGAGNATTAIAKMLDLRLNMNVPKVELLTFSELAGIIGSEDDPVCGIYLEVQSDLAGSMMFILKLESAHYLVDRLMGRNTNEYKEFDEVVVMTFSDFKKIIKQGGN